MSKENVIKFYNEVKKNEKLKTEFEVLQNKLQKTTQFKDFNILAKEIVHIGKKYNFDFSEKELYSYLEELKRDLTDEELLNISGGLSPKIAAIGLLGILGISAIASTAMQTSLFSSNSQKPISNSVASLENEDNESDTGGTDNSDATNNDSAYHANDNNINGTNYDSSVNPTDVNENSRQSLFVTKTPRSINTTVPSLRASTDQADEEDDPFANLKAIGEKERNDEEEKDGDDSINSHESHTMRGINDGDGDDDGEEKRDGEKYDPLANLKAIGEKERNDEEEKDGDDSTNLREKRNMRGINDGDAEESNGEGAEDGNNKDQTASKPADLNVKSAKKDGTWLMLTLENKDKGITITKDALTTLASAAGFKNIDDIQYIHVTNADVSPALGEDLQKTFSEPGTVKAGLLGREYPNTMHRLSDYEIRNKEVEALVSLNVEEKLAEFIVDNKIDVINPDDNSADMNRVSVAIIMRDNGVNENVAQLMKDGKDKEVAIIMDERSVDEDTAIEINKIAKVTSSYTGQWVYATLKDGETSLKINQNTLKYLAETAGFKKADDVKAIQINNGNVIPEISDDLKYKFTIEDYSSSYKNVAMRLKENEIRNDTLDKNGIKKLRFDKSKNAIYITMKTNHDTLNLKNRCEDGKTLLAYIEKLTNVDIDSVYVGKNEQDFNSENGNEGIKIIYDEEYAGSITFESGKDVLDTQKQKIEKISTDGNGNITVILKSDADELFEVNKEVIEYLQNQTKGFLHLRATPLKSLTVKKSDGTAARIRVAQSIKDKYELVNGVLQAKN